MRCLFIVVLLALVDTVVPVWAGEGSQKVVDELICDLPIGEAGQRLVVARGPYLDPVRFKSVRSPSLPELTERFYEVRAELRSAGGDELPIVLAARLRVEDGTTPDTGSVVLDALIEPG